MFTLSRSACWPNASPSEVQMQEPLDYAIDAAGIARITLNRPKRANSVDPKLADALMGAFDHLAAEPKARVLVLLGNGRSFCSGIDLNWMKQGGTASRESNYADALKLANILNRLHTLPIPTLAAVSGHAIGFGAGLVAACDVAIAADTAVFRFSEVRLGIIPAVISPYVIAAMGERPARRYFLNGESFPAAEAVRVGLVHGHCTLEEFGAVTAQMVAELLAGKKHAQAAIKSLLDDMARPRIDQTLIEDTARRLADIRATPEAQAALAEFLAR
jgi:methylglutaconyl-CoA hydratase